MSFSTNISPYCVRVVERLAHGVVLWVQTLEKSLAHTSLATRFGVPAKAVVGQVKP